MHSGRRSPIALSPSADSRLVRERNDGRRHCLVDTLIGLPAWSIQFANRMARILAHAIAFASYSVTPSSM